MIRAIALAAILAVQSFAWSEVKSITVATGFVELEATGGPSVDVLWEAKDPITLPYKIYMRPTDNRLVCVLYLTKVGQYVIQSDSIDWDQKRRWRDTYVVTCVNGPNPTPTPDPEPDEPDLPGIAGETQQQIRRSGIASALISKLAADFEDVGSKCFPRTMPDRTILPPYANGAEAKKAIVSANGVLPSSLKGFTSWLAVVVNNEAKKEPTTEGQVEAIGRVFAEVAKGMRSL